MSKNAHTEIINEITKGINNDLLTWKSSRFANGIMPIVAANNGVIRLDDKEYNTAINSLLNTSTAGRNTGKAVVSVEATKEEWLKKLADKLKDKGGKDSDIYKGVAKDIDTKVENLKKELRATYLSPEGTKKALYDVVRKNAAKKVSSSFLKQPGSSSDAFMSNEEKDKIAEQVHKCIDLSGVDPQYLLKDVNVAEDGLARTIEKKMQKHFGKKVKDKSGCYYLDEKKFSDEKSIAKFSKELKTAITEKYSKGYDIKAVVNRMVSNFIRRDKSDNAKGDKQYLLNKPPIHISSPIQSNPPPLPPRPKSEYLGRFRA